jgi:hypothetical protein
VRDGKQLRSINAISYKEIFLLIKANRVWLGNGMGRWISGFIVPKSYELYGTEARIDEAGNRIVATNSCLWLTNIDHGRRHQPIPLMTMADNLKHSKHKEIKGRKSYDRYDNYDAIEVPFSDAIPSDFEGAMGVPITFLDKYNPDQFEILGITQRHDTFGLRTKKYTKEDSPRWNDLNARSVIRVGEDYRQIYARILIRHRKPAKGKK